MDSLLFNTVVRFLTQAQASDLKTASYPKEYKGLRVRVSFGRGNKSNIPWIAFLGPGQEVQNGIYPVLLYYVDYQQLVLAYGLSETNKPRAQWDLPEDTESIKKRFERKLGVKPFRYDSSYVFQDYDIKPEEVNFGLIEGTVTADVDSLIAKYLLLDLSPPKVSEAPQSIPLAYHPLNAILYGPPGTGKTYHTITRAVAIIRGVPVESLTSELEINSEVRNEIKEEYESYVLNGQISFVTFHQSYGYEDFVEGIKPELNNDGQLEYKIKDGIFKQICQSAGQRRSATNFDAIYSKYISEIAEAGEISLTTPTQSKRFAVRVNESKTLLATPQTAKATTLRVSERMLQNYIEQGILDDYYKPYTIAIGEDIKTKFSDDFKQVDNSNQRYVLIIDEINRGNISKIFGELITMVESSKRIGEPEELRLRLAYSGVESQNLFGVPNNLYLLGTMNSVDRSITSMDSALRRRFHYIRYSANPKLLGLVSGIDMSQLLTVVNERIEFLLDGDHQIGHAYFIDVDSKKKLCEVFRDKLIPLLEEYFLGDIEKVQLVLGDNNAFGKKEEDRFFQQVAGRNQRALFGTDVEGFEDRIIYRMNPVFAERDFENFSENAFISTYKKQYVS